jgi:hypothetical protein
MTTQFLSSISEVRGSLLGVEGRGPHIETWERELNALVYEVYGLREEEMAIVEENLTK